MRPSLEEPIKVGMISMEEKRCSIYVHDINAFFGGLCRDNVMNCYDPINTEENSWLDRLFFYV